MKKIKILSVLLALLICCSGCGFVKEEGTFRDKLDEIDSISIVELGEFDQENYCFVEKPLFDISDVDTFKKELYQLKCGTNWGDPIQLKSGDIVIKVMFNNGDFQLIGWDAQIKHDNSGNHYGFTVFEKEEFESLIEKYEKIENTGDGSAVLKES